MGVLRFTIFFGGLFAIIVGIALLHEWLAGQIAWPNAYGFRCSGRGCWWVELYHSPELLRGGTIYEFELFALLWSIPAAFGIPATFIVIRRWWKRHRNRIRPMD